MHGGLELGGKHEEDVWCTSCTVSQNRLSTGGAIILKSSTSRVPCPAIMKNNAAFVCVDDGSSSPNSGETARTRTHGYEHRCRHGHTICKSVAGESSPESKLPKGVLWEMAQQESD
jgi:hypothetical protein